MARAPGAEEARFVVHRQIGAGGMGAVWLVTDRRRGERFALKRAHRLHPRAMRRFKREFRAVERLRHPGLVHPVELGEDEQGLYLLMEYVEGVDLWAWVHGGGPSPPTESAVQAAGGTALAETLPATERADLGSPSAAFKPEPGPMAPPGGAPGPVEVARRLARVIPGLLEALAFLHAHAIVHRDLKPPNVLVDRGGRARLLDFGVLAELRRGEGADLAGTPGYIAPECIDGDVPSPASDLYALGVTVFELLTGEVPLPADTPVAMLARTLTEAPPRLRDRWPQAPAALDALLAELLAHDPARRPSLERLRGELPAALDPARASAPPPRPSLPVGSPELRLVGRERELRWLRRRLQRTREGRFEVAVVQGPSGIGKSALCEQLLREAAENGGIPLRGQARLTERVPFGGLDEAVDDLAEALARLSLDGERAARIDALRAALAEALPSLAPRTEDPARSKPVPAGSPGATLGALLGEVAEATGQPVVLHVDDVQWLDADAAHLLRGVAGSQPPGVLLLLARRTDVEGGPLGEWMEGEQVERLPLPPLSETALRSLLAERLGEQADRLGASHLEEVAAQCEGLPLLAEIVGTLATRDPGRALRLRPEAALRQAIAEASEEERELLALLWAADDWSEEPVLAEALGWTAGKVERTLRDLRAAGLVRWSGAGRGERRALLYHDAVRRALQRGLDEERTRRAHARWARCLARRPEAAAALRVHHLVGAGLLVEACRLAPRAAEEAAERHAWSLSARMLAVALLEPSLEGPRRHALAVRRAEHLDRAGLYEAAAEAWRAAADASGTEAERRAAELGEAGALLAAGRVVEGRARLQATLAHREAHPPGPVARALAVVRFLAGPRRAPEGGGNGETEPLDAALDARAGTLVGYFDPIAGLRWLQRAQAGFRRAGAAGQAAWCDVVFAYMALFGERRARPVPLAERYLRAAAEASRRTDHADTRLAAMEPFLEGLGLKRLGHWDEAARRMERGLTMMERAGLEGTFEHAMALVHRTQVALFGERPDEMVRWAERLRDAARGRGGSAMLIHVHTLHLSALEWTGERDQVAATAHRIAERFGEPEPMTFQGFLAVLYPRLIAATVEDPVPHVAASREALRRYRRFRPMQSMYAGQFAGQLARAAALAAGPEPDRATARWVRRLAKVAAAAPPFGTLHAERALARIEERLGVPAERVLERLRHAEARAEQLGQRVQVALCRHAIGLRTAGEPGRALRREARAMLEELGVQADLPDREEASPPSG